jgi:hypothetical protein
MEASALDESVGAIEEGAPDGNEFATPPRPSPRAHLHHHHHHHHGLDPLAITPQTLRLLRLAMVTGDFTSADYDSLLELDESVNVGFGSGASPGDINRLPTFAYKKGGNDGPNGKCSICLECAEDGDMMRTLPCFHSFHRDCLDKWLELKAKCPICQFEIGDLNGQI